MAKQSAYVRGTLTVEEAEKLLLSPLRGVRSRAWLVGRIIRQWLNNPRRTLPVELKPDAMGLTADQRLIATRRLALLTRWTNLCANARKLRGYGHIERVTKNLIESLPPSESLSRRTLYVWERQYKKFGLAGLIDMRSKRKARGRVGRTKKRSKAV